MKKQAFLIAGLTAIMLWPADMCAQGWLGKLKAVEKAREKMEQTVEDAVAGHEDSEAATEAAGEEQSTDTPDAESQSKKDDFRRGTVILFEDNFAGEQMGEFPSRWDIVEGNAETASVDGTKYLSFTSEDFSVQPLMKGMSAYLPEVFTLEWDVFISKQGDFGQSVIQPKFYDADGNETGNVEFTYRSDDASSWLYWNFQKPNDSGEVNGDNTTGVTPLLKKGQWNHFAVSFNKRALKYYINGVRLINLPNVAAPASLKFAGNGDYKYRGFSNVILAKGGVDLYERNTTDLSAVEKAIMETGMFVTNNILFETGKATLKEESMAEIRKVADFMKKNPSVRFEVQGHTDNQGSDNINDALSQQRAESVIKALEGMGCDPFNLRAVGKGSHEPVADNKTEEGRAKNRRVVFVKK